MYEINGKFTIPRSNIRLLAMTKAMDFKIANIDLSTEEKAIEYLRSIGLEVKCKNI